MLITLSSNGHERFYPCNIKAVFSPHKGEDFAPSPVSLMGLLPSQKDETLELNEPVRASAGIPLDSTLHQSVFRVHNIRFTHQIKKKVLSKILR